MASGILSSLKVSGQRVYRLGAADGMVRTCGAVAVGGLVRVGRSSITCGGDVRDSNVLVIFFVVNVWFAGNTAAVDTRMCPER